MKRSADTFGIDAMLLLFVASGTVRVRRALFPHRKCATFPGCLNACRRVTGDLKEGNETVIDGSTGPTTAIVRSQREMALESQRCGIYRSKSDARIRGALACSAGARSGHQIRNLLGCRYQIGLTHLRHRQPV